MTPERVREHTACHQTNTGTTPNHSDSSRTSMKYVFAKKTEQNLRGSSTSGPADGDEAYPHDQRGRPHVPETCHIFVPRPKHSVLGEIFPLRTETFPNVQLGNAGSRENKGERVEDESERIAKRGDCTASQKRSDSDCGPLCQLSQGVCRMQFGTAGDCREDGCPAAGEKRRSKHERSTEQKQQPSSAHRDRKNKTQGENGPDQIAQYHDAAAIHPIQQNTSARLNTAMLLKWSPTSLTTWPIQLNR